MIEKAYFSPKNTGEEMLSSSSDCIKSFLRFTLKNKRQGALHEGWQDTTNLSLINKFKGVFNGEHLICIYLMNHCVIHLKPI